MTYARLKKHLAEVSNQSEASVDRVLKALALTMRVAHEAPDATVAMPVSIPSLGKFVVERRAAMIGRNPRTGDAVEIPARNVVKFYPAQWLKDAVK